jgi:hypothetical protein
MGMGADLSLVLHGTKAQPEPGTTFCLSSTTPDYSTYELDFGAAGVAPTVASDVIGQTLPTYPTMPRGGQNWGLHVIVTTAFTSTDSGHFPVTISAISSNSPGDTSTYVVLGSRIFTLTQFEVAGAHYFIPCSPGMLRYLRAMFAVTTGITGNGKVYIYFGPDSDGGM